MAPQKKSGRPSAGEQEQRSRGRRAGTGRSGGRRKPADMDATVETIAVMTHDLKKPVTPVTPPTSVLEDSDFSAGIFEPGELPPTLPPARFAPTPVDSAVDKSVRSVEEEEKPERDELESVRADHDEDAESFIEPAPLEIEDREDDAPILTVEDSDESLIQEARDE